MSRGRSNFQGDVGNGSTTLSNSQFLNTIIIKGGIINIAANTFSGCSSLSSVSIPDSVINIGANAFQNCTRLLSVSFPNSVKNIGASAFSGCSQLKSMTIPESVISIGAGAFTNCLPSLTIVWNYNPALTAAAFCTYYYTVNFPAGTTQISANAFANSRYLPNITIPNTVTSVGANAFANCAALAVKWNYNPALTAANFGAYLIEVNFGSGITSITANAFANCTELSRISISNTVTSLGNNAFYGCSKLELSTMPSGLTSIGSNAFYGIKTSYFAIPYSVTSVGASAFAGIPNCSIYWNYNPALTAENFASLLQYINLPSGLTSISANAFKGSSKVTTISIPATVTNIVNSAFYGCTGFNKISISGNVVTMGTNVFQNCSNLTIYANVTSKPNGWQSTWNSSNRPVFWLVSSNSADVFTGFGYNGSTYYWNGAVNLSISNANNCYYNSNTGEYSFNHYVNVGLTFTVRTVSSKNALSKITGTLSFTLNGTLKNTTTISVSIVNKVIIDNGSFSINTADLSNGTYTLTMTSNFSRSSWSGSSTHKFIFIIDR